MLKKPGIAAASLVVDSPAAYERSIIRRKINPYVRRLRRRATGREKIIALFNRPAERGGSKSRIIQKKKKTSKYTFVRESRRSTPPSLPLELFDYFRFFLFYRDDRNNFGSTISSMSVPRRAIRYRRLV